MARGHRVPARARRLIGVLALLGLGAGCASDTVPTSDPPVEAPAEIDADADGIDDEPVGESGDGLFPDVVGASAERSADGTWRFDVTLSSPYDTPDRYADAWRVLGPDGAELGVRVLAHDHANEQPFTRSLTGVTIPDGLTTVTIEGRDQLNGWGGATVTLDLP